MMEEMMNFNKHEIEKKLNALYSNKFRYGKKAGITVFKLCVAIILITSIMIGNVGYGAFSALMARIPDASLQDIAPSAFATSIFDIEGNVMATLVTAGSNREEVSISDIPQDMIDAVVAIEDERFFEHNGIDLKGIIRAGFIGIKNGSFMEGASTITQQLIKNNVFGGGLETTFGTRLERKIQEQALALKFERQLSKNIILENYLNTINLGNNTLGVQMASKRYFGKSVDKLTLSECAVIAAITQNPVANNPIRYPEKNQERQQRILAKMREQNMISELEYQTAKTDDVYERVLETSTNNTYASYSYYTEVVIDEVLKALQTEFGYTQTQASNLLYGGGLKIHTAMDPSIQRVVDKEVNDPNNYTITQYSLTYRLSILKEDGSTLHYNEIMLNEFLKDHPDFKDIKNLIFDTEEQIDEAIALYKEFLLEERDIIVGEVKTAILQPQASMVVIEQSTGLVKALAGGRGEKTANRTFNRAIDAMRSPGSCFKILATFAPALDTGRATLANVYYDSPISAGDKNFANWWDEDTFLGFVNIRDSIAFSMNLPTMHCLMETVGVDTAFQYVQKLGISTLVERMPLEDGTVLTDRVPSIALGGLTKGVTNIEMTSAYAAIANDGIYNEPIYFTKVYDNNGKLLIENKTESTKVLKKTTAQLLTLAMQSTMVTSNESAYSSIHPDILPTGNTFDFPGQAIAGKSGSTTNRNDLWFEGYTPYYTCGIWSGYDKDQSLGSSQSYHKKIWKKVMETIHEGKEDRGFSLLENITSAKICSKSGLLAIEGVCDHYTSNAQVYEEYFAEGTEPTEFCKCHEMISICQESKLLANKYCPKGKITEKVSMILDSNLLSEEFHTNDEKYVNRVKKTCEVHKEEIEKTTEAQTKEEKTTKGTN